MVPYFKDKNFKLYFGDCLKILPQLRIQPSTVFADPPYFLSNDGNTIESGRIVSVNKGDWDVLKSHSSASEFNFEWLSAIRNVMPKSGTIWISGTYHNIFSVGTVLTELNFKILNVVVWKKTNPPPNYSTRCFTHSTEIIIWARKEEKSAHFYNYTLMKELNGGKQMQDLWVLPAIAPWEKKNGKHKTQKPISLLCRIILASSKEKDIILDPFAGSSTTGIAANLLKRKFVGIDLNREFLELSIKRKSEINSIPHKGILQKVKGLNLEALNCSQISV